MMRFVEFTNHKGHTMFINADRVDCIRPYYGTREEIEGAVVFTGDQAHHIELLTVDQVRKRLVNGNEPKACPKCGGDHLGITCVTLHERLGRKS